MATYFVSRWIPTNHDNSWLLLAAERLSAGGRFYDDIFELNPPLILLVTTPALWLARLTNCGPYLGLIVWVNGLILASALLARPMLGRLLAVGPGAGALAALAYAGTLTWLPAYDFGQREHLAVILFLPAIVWLAWREGEPDGHRPRPLSVLIVGLGAIGFLIKPPLLLIPAVLLLWGLLRDPAWRRLRDPHAILIALICLAYATLVVFRFPEFLKLTRVTIDLYGAYEEPWPLVLRRIGRVLAMGGVVWAIAETWPLPARMRHLARTLALATIAVLLAAALQKKGFSYHLLPAVILVTLLGALLLPAVILQPWGRGRERALATGLAGLLLLLPLTDAGRRMRNSLQQAWAEAAARQPFVAAARELAAGKTFLTLHTGLAPSFPTVLEIDARWGCRGPTQWMVPGIVELAREGPDGVAAAERYRKLATDLLVADFDRFRPDVVAVYAGTNWRAIERRPGERVDLLQLFGTDPAFRERWAGYRLERTVGEWQFFIR